MCLTITSRVSIIQLILFFSTAEDLKYLQTKSMSHFTKRQTIKMAFDKLKNYQICAYLTI